MVWALSKGIYTVHVLLNVWKRHTAKITPSCFQSDLDCAKGREKVPETEAKDKEA